MICKKCGIEIPTGNKFCPNCGEKVEEIISEKIINNNNQYINYGNQNGMNDNFSKKSNTGKIFIIILIFGLLLAGALFLIFGVFNKEKHDFNTNVKNVEHAMSNIIDVTNNSGTIKTSIKANGNNINLNLSAYLKFAKTNNGYDFQLGVDKSFFMDEINAYMRITNDEFYAYFPSNILDLIYGTYTTDSKYLKYNYKFSDLGDYSLVTIIDELKNINKENVNFKDILTENNFKYIGKENNLDHYQLILDETFYKKLYSYVDDFNLDDDYFNQIKFQKYYIDIYLNSKGNFEKIALDLSNFTETNALEKLLFTIEFKDLNNTTISIPQEVINNSIDINEYYNLNSLYNSILTF